MSLSLYSLFSHPLVNSVQKELSIDLADINYKLFPDGESYFRLQGHIPDTLILLDSLDRPNAKILQLIFLSETARQAGVKKVGLIAPYLSYMRQDIQFHSGEGVTSVYCAKLLSSYFDWLITVDPHLHRHHDLNQIYTINTKVVQAANSIAHYIKGNVKDAILVGPDEESGQWVAKVAEFAKIPFVVLKKIRHSDRDVEIIFSDPKAIENRTPVLVDDIISTAVTMIETIRHLKKMGSKPPICIGVHAVFSGDAYESLLRAGAHSVVTCNTIAHSSNQIDLSEAISLAFRELA